MITFSVSVRRFSLEAACLQAAAGQAPLNAPHSATEAPDLQLVRIMPRYSAQDITDSLCMNFVTPEHHMICKARKLTG